MPITLDISGVGLKKYLLFSQTRGIKIMNTKIFILIDKKMLVLCFSIVIIEHYEFTLHQQDLRIFYSIPI